MKRRTHTRARSCDGKRRHQDRAAALAHRASLLALGDTRVTVYACRHCGAWHVGHYRNP
ncbi:hypothetical protein SAMN05216251_108241 [Actinacidiphila alni]|uniref:Uncharacterized protein n=1 Tax=Actinacidiphila alni TaxID=380248 RepID=A0A1I2G301_9ACTN|nr:hypothetical protein [Actinacidiphila alni]SFF11932.1 hypothetical protein SAMN05216251_108241 [Actinacidiphila alni]